MTKTKIDWCDYTWNPVWGCLNNCAYCYARKMAKRIARQIATKEIRYLYPGVGRVKWIELWVELYEKLRRFEPVFLHSNFDKPFPKKPSRIFVNSMSDIAFWKDEWLVRVLLKTMQHPEHIFLLLTKFPRRYARFNNLAPSNLWAGVTITTESQAWASSLSMRGLRGMNRFVSIEPIFQRIGIKKTIWAYDWVIIGAETGNRKGKIIPKREWIAEIVDYCKENNIPVFLKDSLREIWGGELIQEFPK